MKSIDIYGAPAPARSDSIPIYSGLYKSLIQYIDISDLSFRTGRFLGKETLSKFCESIRANGFLRPLLVSGENEVTDGQKRICAATALGYRSLPCVTDPTPLVFEDDLLILKLQDGDADFFDAADIIYKLTSLYLYSQYSVAEALGKSQSYVANKLRLLKFSEKERDLIRRFGLTERHCRALLSLPDAELRSFALEQIIAMGLNVASSEELVSNLSPVGAYQSLRSFERDLVSLVSSHQSVLDVDSFKMERTCDGYVFSVKTIM